MRRRLGELDEQGLAQVLDPMPLQHPPADPGERAAAVLVLVRTGGRGPEVLLVRRGQDLDEHAGQIALPGGRVDAGERHPAQTALREAWEEIGLEPGLVKLQGALSPLSVPVSRHRVQPVVGWAAGPLELRPSSAETAELWFTPLGELLGCASPVQLRSRPAWEFRLPQARVWGMTALVLEDLLARLKLLPRRGPQPPPFGSPPVR